MLVYYGKRGLFLLHNKIKIILFKSKTQFRLSCIIESIWKIDVDYVANPNWRIRCRFWLERGLVAVENVIAKS